ncbi:unnamed protein product, partial [Acanthocheilonema viteae]
MYAAITIATREYPPLQCMTTTFCAFPDNQFSNNLHIEQSRSSGGANSSGQPSSTTECKRL